MTCLDCEFRNECNDDDVESDDVSFSLCGIRIEKLIQIELKRKSEQDIDDWNKEMAKKVERW